MGNNETNLFFENYCSLWSQSLYIHWTKWFNKLTWVSKVKIILWPLPKVTVFKLKYFFSKTVEIFETKYHVKDFGRTGMKIYTNGHGHMTKMAIMPIYGKNPSKSFCPEPVGWLQWNLVCRIGDAGPLQFMKIMTLAWSWDILHQGQV